jgi:uncharacterized membrane protein
MSVAGKKEKNPGLWIARHWLLVINLALGLFIGGTMLPPLLMSLGLQGPARVMYAFYSLHCHQLPQRSYFLFGPHGIDTYSQTQVIAWGADAGHMRAFVGNSAIGFKLGMAQRNTTIFATFFLAGLAFGLVRGRLRGLRWSVFLLLVLPVVLDGGSHVVSEITGLGFRESNTWLASLTGGVFPESFYAGTVIGSFNWLMRTLTGALFAMACVWFTYPKIGGGMAVSSNGIGARPSGVQTGLSRPGSPADWAAPADPPPFVGADPT